MYACGERYINYPSANYEKFFSLSLNLLPFVPSFSSISVQERQKEMTLQRRRKRLKLESIDRNTMEFTETAEFDELISSLQTGDFFARRRSRVNPVASRRLEFSRERPASVIKLEPESDQLMIQPSHI